MAQAQLNELRHNIISSMATRARTLIASNRLPITVQKKDGELKLERASGGLVTALDSVVHDLETLWIGWPGGEVEQDDVAEVEKTLREGFCASPIFVNSRLQQKFVNGFSSKPFLPASGSNSTQLLQIRFYGLYSMRNLIVCCTRNHSEMHTEK